MLKAPGWSTAPGLSRLAPLAVRAVGGLPPVGRPLAALLASLSSENRPAIFVIPRIFDSRTTVLAAPGRNRPAGPFQSAQTSEPHTSPTGCGARSASLLIPRAVGARGLRCSRVASAPRSHSEGSLRSPSLLRHARQRAPEVDEKSAGKHRCFIVIIVTVYRINRMQSCGRSRNDSQ
jgi:hypothetical protein